MYYKKTYVHEFTFLSLSQGYDFGHRIGFDEGRQDGIEEGRDGSRSFFRSRFQVDHVRIKTEVVEEYRRNKSKVPLIGLLGNKTKAAIDRGDKTLFDKYFDEK